MVKLKQQSNLITLRKALSAWRKLNKLEWVTAQVMWSEIKTAKLVVPYVNIHAFRMGLRSLVSQQRRSFKRVDEINVVSRKTTGHKPVEFCVVIKNGKYEEAPQLQINIADQVEEERASYMWKNKFLETKKLLNFSHKENILQKQIIEQVKKNIVAMPPVKFIPFKSKEDRERKKEEAMLLISDAHVGEYVSSAETGGLCEYSFETYVRMLQYIVDTIEGLNKNKIGVGLTKLTIAVLGDMCSGNIHQELEVTNEAHVVTQACMGGYVFSQFLRDISTLFPEVNVICLAGNHGRLQKERRFKQKQLDWDRVYYEIAAAYCQGLKNVTFDISPSTYWVGDINGHTFLLFHGDHIRSWGGIPWYGVLRSITSLKNQYAPHGKIIKYAALGHFHTMGELADVHGDTILNGSFQGGNEFSALALSKVTYPGQHYFGIHPKIGRSWRYPLRLDTAPKTDLIRYRYDLNTSVADLVK